MYLNELYVEHNGPLKRVHLELSFTPDGLPKPTVLVGGNGSGKTNLLSIVADALFEAAAQHYTDVMPKMSGLSRPWFRVVGALTVSVGAPGSVAILRFEHEGRTHVFKEKSGNVPAAEVATRLPESLRSTAGWADGGESIKEFSVADAKAGEIFETGVYAYFPASRAEAPHWLNRESLPAHDFDLAPRFTKRLRKPIYVERSLEQFQQWLLTVILEARPDAVLLPGAEGQPGQFQLVGNIMRGLAAQPVLQLANRILSIILDDPNARFVWLGRGSLHKVGIVSREQMVVPALEALSGGQSTLLAIFGTLLRYADSERWQGGLPPDSVSGICVIDEVDAHMHIDLQHRALPTLIKLFPRVQFLVSSHSPLFALGMERTFQAEGVDIVDMPSGVPVQAEAYTEFGRALEALQETKAFAAAMRDAAGTPGKLLILLEGETDPIYLTTAAQLLGREALLEAAEFEWVGAKDPKSGQGFHTGKDALNHTRSTLLAKPDFVRRPVLLLYDADANKDSEDHGQLHVRSMPKNSGGKIKVGIESLLPSLVVTDEMFDCVVKERQDGGQTSTKILNKMKLCKHVCEVRRDLADFTAFGSVLDDIEALIPVAPATTPAPAPQPVA